MQPSCFSKILSKGKKVFPPLLKRPRNFTFSRVNIVCLRRLRIFRLPRCVLQELWPIYFFVLTLCFYHITYAFRVNLQIQLQECQGTPCSIQSKQARYLKGKWFRRNPTLNHKAQSSKASLSKGLSIRLWTKIFWVRVPSYSLNLFCLFASFCVIFESYFCSFFPFSYIQNNYM